MCAVVLNSESEVTKQIVLLKVIPLQEHSRKNYYPKPVEVLPGMFHLHDQSGHIYIPLSCLICRYAYTVFIDEDSHSCSLQ